MLDWLVTDPTILAAVAALKMAVVALIVMLLGLATKLLWGLSPILKAAIQEWVTTKATARLKVVLAAKASAILDPANPSVSVVEKATEVMKGYPDIVGTLGASQEAVERTLRDTISEVKLAPAGPIASNVVGLKP